NPSDEDKHWFPNLTNVNWVEGVSFAMSNFKDESFIAQYLSPHSIRDLKCFNILDDDANNELIISAIHDDEGYQAIRQTLSNQFNLSNREPNIQVWNVDHRGDRSLTLRYFENDRRPLNDDTEEVMKHLQLLWGFKVRLEVETRDGNIRTLYEFP